MRALGALLVALLIPASASAAPLGEVAPLALRGHSECVVPTGTPGELATRSANGVRFITAARTGLTLGPEVKFEGGFTCGSVATRASGAGVIAGESNGGISALVRDPGGAWGAPVQLATVSDERFTLDVLAAVSERGDVIVAWKEAQIGRDGSKSRLRVARRVAGGAFTSAEQIGEASELTGGLLPAISATGEAFVLTTAIANRTPPFRLPLSVAVAPPGAPFGAPVPIGNTRLLSSPAIDVAADGRALIAFSDGASILVSERAPGGAFGPATTVGPAEPFVLLAPRLAADGAATVAWRRALTGDAQYVTRPVGGAFSAPLLAVRDQALLPADFDPFYVSETFFSELLDGIGFLSTSDDGEILALTGDGRVAFAVSDNDRPQLATFPLAGVPATLSTGRASRLSDPEGSALALADGTPALMWVDSVEETPPTGVERYRIRLAAEGLVSPTDPAVPRVTIARGGKLTEDDSLTVAVRCRAACEVHAEAKAVGAVSPEGALRLKKAGRGELRINDVVPDARGRIPLHVTVGAPDALYPRERTVTVRVAPGTVPTVPRLKALRARRVGDRIRVSFQALDVKDGNVPVFVSGEDTRGWNGEPIVTRTVNARAGKTRYSVTLPARDGVKFVVVRLDLAEGAKLTTTVR